MNKWPRHIEDCLKASIEHGPDAIFTCDEIAGNNCIRMVLAYADQNWQFIPPPKPDIEQWGNEYADGKVFWRSSLAIACNSYANNRIALHHRIVDGKTGKTKFFETLDAFK